MLRPVILSHLALSHVNLYLFFFYFCFLIYYLACGYVGERIYCWGGDTSPTFNLNPTIDEEIYSLNIKAFVGQRSEIMISQWNKMVPTIGFWIGQRRTPTSIALSDGKRLLIQGGDNPGTFKYLNQTAIYDASTNTWTKGSPYTVENIGVRQM